MYIYYTAIQTKELTTFGFTRGVNLYENTNKKLTNFGLKIWQYKQKNKVCFTREVADYEGCLPLGSTVAMTTAATAANVAELPFCRCSS